MNLKAFSASVGAALIIALYSSAVAAERVDAVLHWNEVAQRAMAAANPLVQSRSMAITQLAVFKAVTNASALAAADVGSPAVAVEAAAMAAAHRSLSQLHPEAAATLESALAAGLAGLADAEAKTKGIDIGQRAAEAVLAARMADGWDAKVAYEARSGPGFWAATPPQFAAAVGAQWGKVTPFVLKSGDQFRPGPPAGLNSPAYIAELREVLEMGGANSSSRPAEKTDQVLGHVGGAGMEPGCAAGQCRAKQEPR